jgi:hypothetical protein
MAIKNNPQIRALAGLVLTNAILAIIYYLITPVQAMQLPGGETSMPSIL